MKDPNKVKQGKKSRAAGNAFQKKVRLDLEKSGWFVDKWTNNVILGGNITKEGSGMPAIVVQTYLAPSKPKFNFFTKSLMMNSAGFPDFIAFKYSSEHKNGDVINFLGTKVVFSGKERVKSYEVIGVESKMDGKLDKTEKMKCDWLLTNKVFSKILIASKGEKRGEIIYKEYERR